VLVLLTGGCGKSAAKPDARLSLKLDAIRQAGYPVTLAELDGWYVEPPAAENAAPLYAKAFAALAPVESTSRSFLAQNQRTLDLLRVAASRKMCRYPIDLTKGYTALVPHLRDLKTCAQLLSQAASSHAIKGEMDLAAEFLLDGLHLARSLEQEPLIISRLVQIAAETILQTGLESILSRKAFTDEQLAGLQAAFREAESGVSMIRPLAGDRCSSIAIFQMPAPDQAKAFAQMGGAAQTKDTEAYRTSSNFNADFIFFLDRMDECVAAAKLPLPESLEAVRQWTTRVREAKTKRYVISGLLLPTLETLMDRATECAGRLRVAQTALAVERYRLAHQDALPASLAELAPQFVDGVPTDPFDGQPLRYKKTSPNGFVIYSIGKDRTDQGGTPKPSGARTDAPYDLTFAVRR